MNNKVKIGKIPKDWTTNVRYQCIRREIGGIETAIQRNTTPQCARENNRKNYKKQNRAKTLKDTQYRFRKNRSPQDCIFMIRQIE